MHVCMHNKPLVSPAAVSLEASCALPTGKSEPVTRGNTITTHAFQYFCLYIAIMGNLYMQHNLRKQVQIICTIVDMISRA